MIKNFADRESEKIWQGYFSQKYPTTIQNIARRKLRMLNNAHSINDLRQPPANHLEALKGNKKGKHSIRINDQWRICFAWIDSDCYDVEIIDYH